MVTVFFVPTLGTFAWVEYPSTAVLHEWDKIYREVLIPFDVLGLAVLKLVETWALPKRGLSVGAQEAAGDQDTRSPALASK